MGYDRARNKKSLPVALRYDIRMAGMILDDYLQKQVVGTLKPRNKKTDDN